MNGKNETNIMQIALKTRDDFSSVQLSTWIKAVDEFERAVCEVSALRSLYSDSHKGPNADPIDVMGWEVGSLCDSGPVSDALELYLTQLRETLSRYLQTIHVEEMKRTAKTETLLASDMLALIQSMRTGEVRSGDAMTCMEQDAERSGKTLGGWGILVAQELQDLSNELCWDERDKD